MSDKALGGSMLLVAALVFVYYTTWAIILVRTLRSSILPFHISLSTAILRCVESHTRLFPPARMGHPAASILTCGWTLRHWLVRRVYDHEGESSKSTKSQASRGLTWPQRKLLLVGKLESVDT